MPSHSICRFISDEQSILLQRKIKSDATVARGWKSFDDKMRTYDSVRIEELKRVFDELDQRARKFGGLKIMTRGNYLSIIGHLLADLAFHYRISRSESSRTAVLTMGSWLAAEPKWLTQGANNNWKADLFTAECSSSLGLSIGLLGEGLPEKQRMVWTDSIIANGIEPLLADWLAPQTRIHALDSMGHNWWSVCVSGATLALFSVQESYPQADAWLTRIADSFVEFFEYPGNILQNKHQNFGASGEYIETLGYLDYALHHTLFICDLYRDKMGRDLAAELPVLEKICDYYMANVEVLEGKIYRPNFGNMGSAEASVGNPRHHPAQGWLWLANRFQRDDLFHLVKLTQPQPTSFLEFLFWPSEKSRGTSFAGAPGCCVFESTGEAVLRDSYTESGTFFAIKVGETWNHNHADAGSYILSSHGREFIIDSGTSEYSNPLTYSYFKLAEAHNLILHDGRGQRNEMEFLGTKFMGQIASPLFGANYRYLLADATGPWEGIYQRFYRHVLWIDDFIVMVDDLMAPHIAPWTQLLHYRGVASSIENQTRIENEGKTLGIHHLFPVPDKIETKTGYLSSIVPNPIKQKYKTSDIPYLAFHYPARDRREKFIQLFELPDGADKKIEKIEQPGLSGVRIITTTSIWEIICNHDADGRKMHQNSPVTFNGMSTDAFLLVTKRSTDGDLLSLGVHNGSYVRAGKALLFNALVKSNLHLIYELERMGIESSLTTSLWIDFATAEDSGSLKRIKLPIGQASIWVDR